MHSTVIGSAFDVLATLPDLCDMIFVELGDAYNKATGGKSGKIKAVKLPKRGKAISPFSRRQSEFGVPDGFILPVLYGSKALMKVEGGKVLWIEDPEKSLERHIKSLAGAFKMPLEMAAFDPQKRSPRARTPTCL